MVNVTDNTHNEFHNHINTNHVEQKLTNKKNKHFNSRNPNFTLGLFTSNILVIQDQERSLVMGSILSCPLS